ncbi:MAG: methyltransferase domain-containing protein [Candidatus Caenarcaniphilales bacterium]|nr:methyltransferase domain-containing protein [Candidatus Caenarcaniphilales bacterium]
MEIRDLTPKDNSQPLNKKQGKDGEENPPKTLDKLSQRGSGSTFFNDASIYPDGSGKTFVMNSRPLDHYAIPQKYKDINNLEEGTLLVDLAAGKKAKYIQEINKQIQKSGKNITAIAIDEKLEPAIQRQNSEIFRREDIQKLTSIKDNSVDIIVSNYGPLVFEDYPEENKEIILQQIHRVLKDHGEAIISPVSSENKEIFNLAKNIGFKTKVEIVEGCTDPAFRDEKPQALILTKS